MSQADPEVASAIEELRQPLLKTTQGAYLVTVRELLAQCQTAPTKERMRAIQTPGEMTRI